MQSLILDHCTDSSNRNKDSLAAEAVVHVIIIISQTLATILTRRQMIFLAIASCYYVVPSAAAGIAQCKVL